MTICTVKKHHKVCVCVVLVCYCKASAHLSVLHFIHDIYISKYLKGSSLYQWKVAALTSLIEHDVRFILLHQSLHLLGLQGRVQDLVEPRVPLLVVDEFSHLIYCEVWPALSTTTEIE